MQDINAHKQDLIMFVFCNMYFVLCNKISFIISKLHYQMTNYNCHFLLTLPLELQHSFEDSRMSPHVRTHEGE